MECFEKMGICQGVGEEIRPFGTKSQLFLKHFGGGSFSTLHYDYPYQQQSDKRWIYNSKVLHNSILNMMRASDISVDRWEVWRVASIDALTREKPVLTGRTRGRLAHLAAYSPRRVKTIYCAGNTSGMHGAELDVNCNYGKSNTFRMFPCEFVILLSFYLLQQLCLTSCINMIFDHLTKDVALSKHQLETRETSASERGPCTIYCHLWKYLYLFLLMVKFGLIFFQIASCRVE